MKLTAVLLLLLGIIITIQTTTAQNGNNNSTIRRCICVPIYDCNSETGELLPVPMIMARFQSCAADEICCFQPLPNATKVSDASTSEVPSSVTPSSAEFFKSRGSSAISTQEETATDCICVPFQDCNEETKTIKQNIDVSLIMDRFQPLTICENAEEICCTPTNATPPVKVLPSTPIPTSSGFINSRGTSVNPPQIDLLPLNCVCVPYQDCDEATNTTKQHVDLTLARKRSELSTNCENANEVCCIPATTTPPVEILSTDNEVFMNTFQIGPSSAPMEVEEPKKEKPPRCGIFTGNDTNMPWQVMVQVNDELICAGSIIHPRVILTSGLCVKSRPHWLPKVVAPNGEVRPIIKMIGRNPLHSNDILLVVIDRPIPNVPTVCLPKPEETIFYDDCIVSGLVLENDEFANTIIHTSTSPYYRYSKVCERFIQGMYKGITNYFYVGRGSPLLCPVQPNVYVQTGIASHRTDYSRIYTKVAYFRNWIDEIMMDLNFDTSLYDL